MAHVAGLEKARQVLGLGADPAFDLALRAGDQLMHPLAYTTTILAEVP